MDKERLNLEVPKELKKKIKLYAVKNDSTIQEVIVEAVEDYLKNQK